MDGRASCASCAEPCAETSSASGCHASASGKGIECGNATHRRHRQKKIHETNETRNEKVALFGCDSNIPTASNNKKLIWKGSTKMNKDAQSVYAQSCIFTAARCRLAGVVWAQRHWLLVFMGLCRHELNPNLWFISCGERWQTMTNHQTGGYPVFWQTLVLLSIQHPRSAESRNWYSTSNAGNEQFIGLGSLNLGPVQLSCTPKSVSAAT